MGGMEGDGCTITGEGRGLTTGADYYKNKLKFV